MNTITSISSDRYQVQSISLPSRQKSVRDMVREGLTARRKSLPPILLYDALGSRLFEQICHLDEYYLTRTEQRIIDDNIVEMMSHCAPAIDLVELGSGSSVKTRSILDSLFATGHRPVYRPIDISTSMLESAAQALLADYPHLHIHAIAADYQTGLREISASSNRQKVILFLGSNIGNFTSAEAQLFLDAVHTAMSPGDLLFLGVDLIKPVHILEAAYNDTDGITAQFNLNLLRRLNTELGANFDLARFTHSATWNADTNAMEMHLVSSMDQSIYIHALDLVVNFTKGESIHTESSHKYSIMALREMIYHVGLTLATTWVDSDNLFAMNLILAEDSRVLT